MEATQCEEAEASELRLGQKEDAFIEGGCEGKKAGSCSRGLNKREGQS